MNALYDSARAAFLGGTLSWTSATIRAVLVDMSLYPARSEDTALATIPLSARLAISPAFTGKNVDGGVATAAPITFTAVPGSAQALVIYSDGGSDAASPLIAFLDTAVGLPVVANGANITVTWDTGVNGIFKL